MKEINNSCNNSFNNSCNNIPNNYSDISNSFYKVWHNITIRHKIIGYLKQLNLKNLLKKKYYNYSQYRASKDRFDYSSIIINFADESVKDLISFLKYLPGSVRSIEFQDIVLNVNIRDLVLPESLKEISNFDIFNGTHDLATSGEEDGKFEKCTATIFNHLLLLKLPDSSTKFQNSLSSLKSLTWLDVGDNFSMKLKPGDLPNTLQHFRLGKGYCHLVEKGVLPDSLESLSIASEYRHSTIELPPHLKSLCFEKSSIYLSLSILNCVPKSVTNLDISGRLMGLIGPLANRLPRSLSRLKICSYIESNCFKPSISLSNYHIKGFPKSLTYLNISVGSDYYQLFNPNHLPPTLKVLKLNNIRLDPFKKGNGFPNSLTSLECDSVVLQMKFNNPSNILHLKVYFNYSFYVENSILSKMFPNIKSFKSYSSMLFNELQFKPLAVPTSVTNLEMLTLSPVTSAHPIKFASNNNIKSLKLDRIQTFSILNIAHKQQQQQQDPIVSSPFPTSCLLLDLNFDDLIYTEQDPPPITLNMLPPSLKVLILRGKKTSKLLFNSPSSPLPSVHHNTTSLESIFIYDQNQSIINHAIYSPIQIITFNQDQDRISKLNNFNNSILYRKLKKYINHNNLINNKSNIK